MPRLGWAGAALGVLLPLVALGQWFAPAPYNFGGFGASTAAESYQRGFAGIAAGVVADGDVDITFDELKIWTAAAAMLTPAS